MSCATSASRSRSWSWRARRTAADAADLVVVEYDTLPDGTPLFDHLDDDVAEMYAVGDDAEGLFDGCDVVVSLALTHPRMAACPLETRAAASAWDADGRLHHWLSVQAPHAVKMGLQAVFGLDPTMVHVVAPDVGGGFGPKFGNYPEDVVTAWVALPYRSSRAAGSRPAARACSRCTTAAAQTQTVTLGGTRAGELLAYHLDVEQDAGAYASLGVYVPEATLRMTTGVYAIPRARGTARARHLRDHAGVGLPGERPPRSDGRDRACRRRVRARDRDGSGRAPAPQPRRCVGVPVHHPGRHRVRHR